MILAGYEALELPRRPGLVTHLRRYGRVQASISLMCFRLTMAANLLAK